MKKTHVTAIAFAAVVLFVLGGIAVAQQDKYALKVPGGSRSPNSGDTKAGRLLPPVKART